MNQIGGVALFLLPLLSACGPQAAVPANGESSLPSAAANAAADAPTAETGAGADGAIGEDAMPAPPPERRPIAVAATLAEWRKAENRSTCAPLVLTDDAAAGGKPRHAAMSGGWGVAFDLPNIRSAYGVAGAGVKIDDAAAWAERVKKQWPYSRPIGGRDGGLPGGSIAGYGLDGARPFTEDNPDGRGERLGAYVVIPGQGCLYNLWSQLGRTHMETMIDHLSLRTGS